MNSPGLFPAAGSTMRSPEAVALFSDIKSHQQRTKINELLLLNKTRNEEREQTEKRFKLNRMRQLVKK